MEKIAIKYFEVFANYGCNLRCIGCSSFCDYMVEGIPNWETIEHDLKKWADILNVENIGVLGGEPLMNPDLYKWLEGIRNIYNNSTMLLVTNGLLLDRWPDLIKKMIDLSPGEVMITLHVDYAEIIEKIQRQIKNSKYRFIKKAHKDQAYYEVEYILFAKNKKFSIHVVEPDKFLKRYKGYGKNIYPYENDNIEEAHELCIDRPIMYEGKIYRCSKMALLKRQLMITGQFFDQKEIGPWKPYLDYEGVSYNDDIEKIQSCIAQFDKAEMVCKSCPGKSDDCMIKNEQNMQVFSFNNKNFIGTNKEGI